MKIHHLWTAVICAYSCGLADGQSHSLAVQIVAPIAITAAIVMLGDMVKTIGSDLKGRYETGSRNN